MEKTEHFLPHYYLSLVGVPTTLSGTWILKWVAGGVLWWVCGECFLPAAFPKLCSYVCNHFMVEKHFMLENTNCSLPGGVN